ncbi:hypothetical protein KKC87_03935 [Patescibacteria group bacterium]|nr:hypothetical protein [Patescibacteria group bacterium]
MSEKRVSPPMAINFRVISRQTGLFLYFPAFFGIKINFSSVNCDRPGVAADIPESFVSSAHRRSHKKMALQGFQWVNDVITLAAPI